MADIAKKLGVSEEEVVNMNRRLSGSRFFAQRAAAFRIPKSEWQDWLADDTIDQETRLANSEEMDERHDLLTDALGELSERERDIIQARRLREEPATLEELSQKYGVSRERVRQIEVRAFEKLQLQMKRTLAEKRSHTLVA